MRSSSVTTNQRAPPSSASFRRRFVLRLIASPIVRSRECESAGPAAAFYPGAHHLAAVARQFFEAPAHFAAPVRILRSGSRQVLLQGLAGHVFLIDEPERAGRPSEEAHHGVLEFRAKMRDTRRVTFEILGQQLCGEKSIEQALLIAYAVALLLIACLLVDRAGAQAGFHVLARPETGDGRQVMSGGR